MLDAYKMLICTHKCPGFSLLCHSFSSWLLFLKFPYNSLVTVSFSWWLSPSLAWWEFSVSRTHSLHLPTLPAVAQVVLEKVGYLYTPLCSHPMYPTAESTSGWRTALSTRYCNTCRANGAHLIFSELQTVSLTLLGPISPSRKKELQCSSCF